jgi:PilZ domain
MDASEIATRNRRFSRRRRTRNLVRLSCYRSAFGFGPNVGLHVLDLSETGIRMLVRVPLKQNEEIVIELSGAGQRRPTRLPANVSWVVATADQLYCVGASFQRRLRYANLQQLV